VLATAPATGKRDSSTLARVTELETAATSRTMTNPIVQFGYHKGEVDFSVSATVDELSVDEMNDLRAMIVVGIGTMEQMWRTEQQRKAPAAQTNR
jgi:hypothetical protein